MTIQFRSLFPLALPGMLALLGWWWFFSRKKERISRQDKQVEASALEVGTDPSIKDLLLTEDTCLSIMPAAPSITQPPEKDLTMMNKPSVEPPALLRAQPAPRRSESSGHLVNITDIRLRPGTRKDESAKLELVPTCDEAKSIPLECPLPSPKGLPFPHEAAEVCKPEPIFSRMPARAWPGQSAALTEKHGPGEKAKEMGWAEGTGDAVLGESVLEEGMLSMEHGYEMENSKVPTVAPLGGGEETGKNSPLEGAGPVQKEEHVTGQLLDSIREPAHTELEKDEEVPAPGIGGGQPQDGDLAGEVGKEEMVDKNEELEQAAFQIISKVILEATEEVQATVVNRTIGHMCQTMDNELQGPVEESCAPVSQEGGLGREAVKPTQVTAEVAAAEVAPAEVAPDTLAAALPLSGLVAEDSSPPKTYISCLNSPLSSPTKDSKPPRNSAHHISLTPCPSQATSLRELRDKASILVDDASCATCMSDSSQHDLSGDPSAQASDSASTSGPKDSCTDTSLSPGDKNINPPPPESTVPFSNGVLKEELSDLGAEDGWSMDAETDHSGGSEGNSMDSVDSCCSLRKTDSSQSAQADSDPKKVDLIIWEIEVPKHLVGRLIGKQGRYVSFLKQTSGAKIYISTLPYTQNVQICHIEGSQHHVDKALTLIGKKFKELNLTNIYTPPRPSLALPSLPMTSWLMLPSGVTVEVIVVNQVNAGHLFVQQHTHPTFHALRSLDQQMYLCYSQPGIPTLPIPVEIAVICAAPGADGAWWRAQVVASYEETSEVEIRYVDYGGYKRVKVDMLRQIRSDFVTLPFQGAEVLLDSVMPLSDDERFSPEADAAMSEMTGNTALLAQVTSYSPAGLPLIQLWSVVGDEVVLINRWLVERGFAQWVDSSYTSL